MLNACRTSLHWLASSPECRASATSMNLSNWQQLGTPKLLAESQKSAKTTKGSSAGTLSWQHSCLLRAPACSKGNVHLNVDMRDSPATWLHSIPFHLGLQKMFIFHKSSELQRCWSSRLGLDDHAASIQIEKYPAHAERQQSRLGSLLKLLALLLQLLTFSDLEWFRFDSVCSLQVGSRQLKNWWNSEMSFSGSTALLYCLPLDKLEYTWKWSKNKTARAWWKRLKTARQTCSQSVQ